MGHDRHWMDLNLKKENELNIGREITWQAETANGLIYVHVPIISMTSRSAFSKMEKNVLLFSRPFVWTCTELHQHVILFHFPDSRSTIRNSTEFSAINLQNRLLELTLSRLHIFAPGSLLGVANALFKGSRWSSWTPFEVCKSARVRRQVELRTVVATKSPTNLQKCFCCKLVQSQAQHSCKVVVSSRRNVMKSHRCVL